MPDTPAPVMPEPAVFRLPPGLLRVIFAEVRLLARSYERRPDVSIGGTADPYMRRWHITPRGDGPATYLHQFLRDDDDRALHDHPWPSVGIILAGGYREHLPGNRIVGREVGDVIYRAPEQRHRVELHRDGAGQPIPAWTLFLVGNRVREWGFWCPGTGQEGAPERFVHWQDFTAGEHGELVGKGCGA